MTKLHEVLAIAGDAQGAAKQILAEQTHTFAKRAELFLGTVGTVSHFQESDKILDTEEVKPLATTVPKNLDYLSVSSIRHLDTYLQREEANTRAFGDIEVDGKVIAEKVPATVLLGLESKLVELRRVYESLPTLSPGMSWLPDPDAAMKGVYKTEHPEIRFRTRKKLVPVIMSPATDKHPAQVKESTLDEPIAKITQHTTSGMTTSAIKSELLERLDRLIEGVKKARQRANGVDVDKTQKLGHAIFKHLHDGLVT